MKASIEKILPQPESSANIHMSTSPTGYQFDWHQHPEVELTAIIEGKGQRYVGEHISTLDHQDVVLLGGMVPHTWEIAEPGKAVVVQFLPERLLGKTPPPEYEPIVRLLQAASQGIEVKGRLKGTVLQQMTHLPGLPAFERRQRLLHLLHQIATTPKDTRRLSSVQWHPKKGRSDLLRIDKACGYLSEHYLETVCLADVATAVGMSEAALCRAFKRATGQTVLAHLTAMRITHAMRLLRDSDESISRVAFASGFHNLSTFNRCFKDSKGIPPSVYRNEWNQKD